MYTNIHMRTHQIQHEHHFKKPVVDQSVIIEATGDFELTWWTWSHCSLWERRRVQWTGWHFLWQRGSFGVNEGCEVDRGSEVSKDTGSPHTWAWCTRWQQKSIFFSPRCVKATQWSEGQMHTKTEPRVAVRRCTIKLTHTNKKRKEKKEKFKPWTAAPYTWLTVGWRRTRCCYRKPDGHGEKCGRRGFDRMFRSSMPALSEQTEALLPAGDGLEVIFVNWPLVMRLGILHKITEGFNPSSSEEPYTVMSTRGINTHADIMINIAGAVFLPLVTWGV